MWLLPLDFSNLYDVGTGEPIIDQTRIRIRICLSIRSYSVKRNSANVHTRYELINQSTMPMPMPISQTSWEIYEHKTEETSD